MSKKAKRKTTMLRIIALVMASIMVIAALAVGIMYIVQFWPAAA